MSKDSEKILADATSKMNREQRARFGMFYMGWTASRLTADETRTIIAKFQEFIKDCE